MKLPISLEFFPPKTAEGSEKLRAARQKLYALKPEFCSVTYGAGGSTQQGTFDTVSEIMLEGVDAASHLSCIGATKDKVREALGLLDAMGVKRVVALRGDLPSGTARAASSPTRATSSRSSARRRATSSASMSRAIRRCTRRLATPMPT